GSNNGILTNGATTAVGRVGRAFSFDGIDDEVAIADDASLNRQSFTIDAWVFPTAVDGQIDIIVNKEVGTGIGQLQYEIGIRGTQAGGSQTPGIPTGNLAFFVGTPTRGCAEFSGWCDGQAAVALNTWTHVALKYDGTSGTATAYVNGQVTRTAGGFSGVVPTTTGPLRIGSRSPLPPLFQNEKFKGLIDEVEFFDRPLAGAEIQAIFGAGAAGKCKTKSVFVPIVLSSAGLSGSFFTSEMAITNRGAADATLSLQYSAAFGGGSGTGSLSLPAGRQRIIADAIESLRTFGVPIPDSGNRGGTLIVGFSGVSSPSEAAVVVRTTTAVSNGRAGLAYLGVQVQKALGATSYLCGLRQNTTDRSNVALQNVGTTGDVILRVTVFSGDPALPGSQVLPDVTLTPGGFFQFSEILKLAGYANGYVRVERMSGTAPYYAYGVINDQANSDGSFLFPVVESSLTGKTGQTLPV
ncbi:MAG: LamG domain-containing protein, partial [Acidobacteria bacterium]|nr:LamG domain-containing protein [Acidobacteriota bacterium]